MKRKGASPACCGGDSDGRGRRCAGGGDQRPSRGRAGGGGRAAPGAGPAAPAKGGAGSRGAWRRSACKKRCGEGELFELHLLLSFF